MGITFPRIPPITIGGSDDDPPKLTYDADLQRFTHTEEDGTTRIYGLPPGLSVVEE